MKKKLLTVAIGTAIFAGSLAAQAATTLYGHIHMSWDRLDNGDTIERSFISSNSTRVGLRGDEDLGSGLKAIWQIESGSLGVDDATNGFGGDLRNSFIGFTNNSWGTVKVGRHDTPYKDLGRRLDNFNEQVGDARNVLGVTNLASFDLRPKNMVRYDSPAFGGFTFAALSSSNNGTDETSAATQSVTSLGANWTAGPLFVGGAYEKHTTGLSGAGTKDEETGIRLATSYALGDLLLGLVYEMISDMDGIADVDKTVLGLIASYKMGNNRLKFQWFDSDELDCPSPGCPDTGANMLAIGLDHVMSKTVTTYINYAKVDNDTNIRLPVASANGGHGEVVPGVFGRDPKGLSLGVILKF